MINLFKLHHYTTFFVKISVNRYLKSFKKHRLNHALERLQRAPSSESQVLTERSDQVSSTGEPSQLETGSVGDASPLQVDVEDRDRGGRDTPSEGAREEGASSETASVQENPNDDPLPESGAGGSSSLRNNSNSGVTTATAVSDAEDAAMEDERLEPLAEATTTSSATSLNLTVARAASLHHHEAERRERRFACPFCGKCVRSKENLKLHVRKHTGERPFVCLFCGRAFGGKSDLTRHLRIHTGERPYHCEMCGKCFARADYLSKHLTTHIHQR